MNDLARTIPVGASNPGTLLRPNATVARALVALLFIVAGVQKVFGFEGVAGWMASEGVPLAPVALALTIVVEIGGGAALLFGFGQRIAAWLLAALVVVATLVFHAFWAVPADQFGDQLTQFLKNAAVLGGLLLLARDPNRAD